jgi:hypothetical protein
MLVQQSVYKKIGFGLENCFFGCRIADFFFVWLLIAGHSLFALLSLVNHYFEPGRWTLFHAPDFCFSPLP